MEKADVNLFIESLDSKRFKQDNFNLFSSYLFNKYKDIRFNVVIVSDNDALDFAFQYGDSLFPDIPVVFCGINNPEDYDFNGSRMYGYTESVDPKRGVSVLTKMLPKARSLLLISDNTTTGTIIFKEKQKIQILYPYIKLNFETEIDVDEILKTVKKGDKGDLVYILRVNRDKYGNNLNFLDFFKKIADASPNPVFADDEAIIGHGVVGGNANRGFTQGYKAGSLALDILENKNLKTYQHVNTFKEKYIFDYKQLKRFGIDKRNLPENSIIINKPTIRYLRYIIALTIIIILLGTIVVVLSINIQKRILAEKKVGEQLTEINERNTLLEESYMQVSDLNCELEEANAQLVNLNLSLEESKKKAEESEKLKSSFLANLSHEIRTPLNAILGFSSLLITPNIKEASKKSYYDIIQSNSESLLVLIDDILDFSRIEAEQIQIHREPVVVNEIFKELFSYFQEKNSKPEVRMFITEFAQNRLLTLNTDKIRFKQILSNLLTNAFKFTETGEIEIGFRELNTNEILFFVRDTGIGIDKKYHEAIFDRFRKVENETTSFYGGSGIGLAICKRLTELLGGKIWVEGDTGQGSTFYFTHPVA